MISVDGFYAAAASRVWILQASASDPGTPLRTHRKQGAFDATLSHGERWRHGGWPEVSNSRRGLLLWGGLWLGRLVLVLGLPFWLLVRGALLAHDRLGANAWAAVLVGAIIAALWIALIAARVARRVTRRSPFRAIATRVVLPCVIAFCVYALFYVSPPNVKTQGVRISYTEVHPILRISLATLILFDPEIVITDMAREPGDYSALGLSPRANSLHYVQADGWVHAVDLRTKGRGFVRVGLTRFYFWLMGFDSLRHSGNADHLHVSLAATAQHD